MKKQTKQLLALAGVLVLCVGVYAGLRVWNAGAEEREAAAADYVVQLTDVTALSFDNGGGTLAFTKTDDNWTLDTDADFPVDGTYLDALANGLESVEAERILEDPDELADYGLEDPGLHPVRRDGGRGERDPLSGKSGRHQLQPLCHAGGGRADLYDLHLIGHADGL